ncbi:cobaltochelatase subunit CobN, partial [Pseudomonas aeruginosa]|uniref:cobaltochelatase subunit CobN n=1 Tax=Pseudomonas aeruginosa TaxID=287 RepID=UPI0022385AEE
QEWLPGKDRGLAVGDYPLRALGDLPVFYPYIQDNVGEAIQARPRWDAGGRLLALDIVPAAELGRPRVDVVLQVTSVYRDQFDG